MMCRRNSTLDHEHRTLLSLYADANHSHDSLSTALFHYYVTIRFAAVFKHSHIQTATFSVQHPASSISSNSHACNTPASSFYPFSSQSHARHRLRPWDIIPRVHDPSPVHVRTAPIPPQQCCPRYYRPASHW